MVDHLLVLLYMLNLLVLQFHRLALFSHFRISLRFENFVVIYNFERIVSPERVFLARQCTVIVEVAVGGATAEGRLSEEVVVVEVIRQLHSLTILIFRLFLRRNPSRVFTNLIHTYFLYYQQIPLLFFFFFAFRVFLLQLLQLLGHLFQLLHKLYFGFLLVLNYLIS